MKKYILFLCLYLSASTASASFFCFHWINVNNDFPIIIEFQDWRKSELTNGLYFDLVVWAKNVESELTNVKGRVNIDYLRASENPSILMWISESDTAGTAYRFFYDAEKAGVKITKYTNVNTGYTRDFIVVEEYFLSETKDLTKAIIMRLNANFGTNGRYGDLDTVELFVKNNRENVAKCETGKIFSDHIYLNKEKLIKSIEEQPDFFIETIRINRKEVDNIVQISLGCG